MHYYKGCIAKKSVNYAFRHQNTEKYFDEWISPAKREQNAILVPEKDIQEQYQKYGIPDSAYAEYTLSVYHTSDHLLSQGICAFHAAAFLWKGKAFFFSGPSGTGKSTQLKNWCSLYREETEIMNGDKPIIKAEDDHIQVYPSPWKGKERLGSDSLSAPLGGIICLSQGKSDQIRRLDKRFGGRVLLPRFLCRFEDRETVLFVCKLANLMLDTVPVWQLVNTGSKVSAELVHEALSKEVHSYASTD